MTAVGADRRVAVNDNGARGYDDNTTTTAAVNPAGAAIDESAIQGAPAKRLKRRTEHAATAGGRVRRARYAAITSVNAAPRAPERVRYRLG